MPEISDRVRSFGLLFPTSGGEPVQLPNPRGDSDRPVAVVVGDVESGRDVSGWSGNAVDVSRDFGSERIRVRTSVSGFPPAFEVRTDEWWGVTTSLALLVEADVGLHLDDAGLLDVCRLGFPVDRRTLFHGVSLLPAGAVAEVSSRGTHILESWEPENGVSFRSFAEYSAHQKDLFGRIVDDLPTGETRFSLSGGLDTRAIFAGLVRGGEVPACYTVSGPKTSLDAVLARDLCAQYSARHDIIRLDGEFYTHLWEAAERASLYSGGVSALWSAPQTYCYTRLSLPGEHPVVLSGFLGNQVGRGSTEGISSRPVDLGILSEELRGSASATTGEDPWYERGRRPDGEFDRRFLIQEENQYASMAGYSIGHAHAVQRSPYSDVELLSAAANMPPPPETGRAWLDPRITEMAKRFVGVGETSFQGPFIAETGGAVAHHPINYGWTAAGRPSPWGLMIGARAFAEDILTVAARRSSVASAIQRISRLDGFSTHLYADRWIPHIREPLQDALASREVREAGILDVPVAREAVASFSHDQRFRLETVIAVADLTLLTLTYGVERA